MLGLMLGDTDSDMLGLIDGDVLPAGV